MEPWSFHLDCLVVMLTSLFVCVRIKIWICSSGGNEKTPSYKDLDCWICRHQYIQTKFPLHFAWMCWLVLSNLCTKKSPNQTGFVSLLLLLLHHISFIVIFSFVYILHCVLYYMYVCAYCIQICIVFLVYKTTYSNI